MTYDLFPHVAASFVPSTLPNMNGEYQLSTTPGGNASRFPTHFKDYPRGVEMFEVYSPNINTLYSQVFWAGLDPVELPEAIVKKYDGRGMAVVGFEIDQVVLAQLHQQQLTALRFFPTHRHEQVRRTASGDVSVPINVAYNHHFESNMVGKNSMLEKISLTGGEERECWHFPLSLGSNVIIRLYLQVRQIRESKNTT